MKQYTAQDVLKRYNKDALARFKTNVAMVRFCFSSDCLKRNDCYNLCGCLDAFPTMGYSAFDECPNCFGYGRPPIPPNEVGL